MKEQTLSPVERCPALSVDSKPLGVLDNPRHSRGAPSSRKDVRRSCYSTASTALPTAVWATSAAGPRVGRHAPPSSELACAVRKPVTADRQAV
ncbi:hypothetical protein DEV91_11124 [Phyllobacterium brassicacearum]|nr:hypothetical protein DEV91_11124 [Phyllobacterium brassicacearum]